MSQFFSYYPKTLYSNDNKPTSLDTITNIISRFRFEPTVATNAAAFYYYNIKDSDTPEIIASKYYDNPERHWIVLMFNDIIDPFYDWPLNYHNFIEFVDKKYTANGAANTPSQTGLAWAMDVNNVKEYFKVITSTVQGSSTIEKISVDVNAYINVSSSSTSYSLQDGNHVTVSISKETQTYYDYENELNESKRAIKLLKPEYVSQVEDEFQRIISA